MKLIIAKISDLPKVIVATNSYNIAMRIKLVLKQQEDNDLTLTNSNSQSQEFIRPNSIIDHIASKLGKPLKNLGSSSDSSPWNKIIDFSEYSGYVKIINEVVSKLNEQIDNASSSNNAEDDISLDTDENVILISENLFEYANISSKFYIDVISHHDIAKLTKLVLEDPKGIAIITNNNEIRKITDPILEEFNRKILITEGQISLIDLLIKSLGLLEKSFIEASDNIGFLSSIKEFINELGEQAMQSENDSMGW